jgi:uncharacterized protein YbjT (DUF2867 family)
MRVVVIGGHGRTGIEIVKQLVARGDKVLATIRNPKHMATLVKAGAETWMLDLDKSTGPEFAAVMVGADAVVFAAGSGENESSEIDRTGTLKTVRAAKKAGVERYVTVSALGATTPVPQKWDTPEMADYWKAKRAANKYVRESGLAWTIIEPGELTDSKATGKVTLALDGIEVGKISRADVAAVVVAALATPASKAHTLQIVSGKTAIAEAIAAASKTPAPAIKPVRKAPEKKAPAGKAPAKKAAAKTTTAKKAAARKASRKVPAKKTAPTKAKR